MQINERWIREGTNVNEVLKNGKMGDPMKFYLKKIYSLKIISLLEDAASV